MDTAAARIGTIRYRMFVSCPLIEIAHHGFVKGQLPQSAIADNPQRSARRTER